MSKPNKWKKYIGLAGILFLFPLAWVLLFGVFGKHNFNTLRYFGPEALQGAASSDYTLPPFAFQNQDGEIITNDSLRGKIWLAAFYDLSNPHLAKITERLLNINFKYRAQPDIRIVVFSTNCDFDTPTLRKNYIDQNTRYNTFSHKWEFLTTNQEAMQSFIRNGFLIRDIHNEAIFRLVDEYGHIRGIYGNTEYHMEDAMEDIALLKKETDLRKYNERKALENAR
jgi:protein SCO1